MLPEQEASSVVMQYVFKGGEAAIKVAGAAAKNLSLILIALLQQKNRSSGQVWVKTMVQQGTPLLSFPLPTDKLKEFKELATARGVMYARIKSKNKDAAVVDILAKQNDVALLKDIFGRLGFGELPIAGTIDSSSITPDDRLRNELAGADTIYDYEVKDSAERPTRSGRRGAPSARSSQSSRDIGSRESVRVKLKSISQSKQTPEAKIPVKAKAPRIPTK